MCNLYRMTKGKDEVAKWFDAVEMLGGANFGEEVYPGYPGLVVAEGQSEQMATKPLTLKQMTWGFPLVMKGKNGQPLKPKPVNNARTEKLESFFWRFSFEERRCLIPLTAWAEAQGDKGSKTRTWISRPDADLFACAGVWRDSDEFGLAFSMVMTETAGSQAESVHSRMPVLLRRDDYEIWIAGSTEEARALCKPWDGNLNIERTDQPWTRGSASQKTLL